MDDAELDSVLSAIVNGMILADNSPEQASSTLQVLSKIVSNALSGDDPKFRRLPATNEKIRERVINVSGASEFLDAIGFSRQQDGAGDFVLADNSKLRIAANVLNEALASAPKPPVKANPAKPVVQGITSNGVSTDQDEYELRKKEAEARQAEIRRKMEEERRQQEALRLKIKAEQREVRDRPVTASHAVHVSRHEPSAGGGDGKIRYTNSDREFQSVISSKPAVIANFTASWCGPCQAIAPMVEEMARNNPKVTFIKIDIDENSETPSQFNVSAVPTFILFKNGKVAGEVKGANAQGVQNLVAQA